MRSKTDKEKWLQLTSHRQAFKANTCLGHVSPLSSLSYTGFYFVNNKKLNEGFNIVYLSRFVYLFNGIFASQERLSNLRSCLRFRHNNTSSTAGSLKTCSELECLFFA